MESDVHVAGLFGKSVASGGALHSAEVMGVGAVVLCCAVQCIIDWIRGLTAPRYGCGWGTEG